MIRRLSLKFIILYALIAAAAFVLISTLGSVLIADWLVSNESMAMYETAGEIADQYKSKSIQSRSRTDYSSLEIIAAMDGVTVQMINSSGTVYLDTSQDYAEDYSCKIDGFDPSYFDSGYYIVGDFFGTFESETLTVLAPITSQLTVRGYVAVHMPMSSVYAERESLLSILHMVEIIILLLTLSIIIMMHFWVFRPITAITNGARQISAGNYRERINIKSRDEIGELAESLNYMAKELGEANENQRKFISNVSHDFRSPLTSIKGYAEAIKDGVIPYEQKDRYLDIILSETSRLTKLTSELLSLDNIEGRMRRINYSVFDINQLIRDTALSFGMTCVKKNIKFNLSLEGSSLIVSADHGRIQQVVYNLVDNAIKFSRHGSSIDIETTSRGRKVSVSVKDYGVGIASSDLPKIWKRFFKADSSRGKDRTGSGLGLSIVKEIIQSHGQKITVVSTENAGTEFTFTLEAAETGDAA